MLWCSPEKTGEPFWEELAKIFSLSLVRGPWSVVGQETGWPFKPIADCGLQIAD